MNMYTLVDMPDQYEEEEEEKGKAIKRKRSTNIYIYILAQRFFFFSVIEQVSFGLSV